MISQTIENLIGGVSQQTPSLRRANQCEEQENCRNDPVEGMGKRHNSELIANLTNLTDPDKYIYQYVDRDETEKYVVAVAHGDVQVFDQKTGYEYPTVIDSSIQDYLKTRGDVSPQRAYQMLNIADTTFVLNKTVPVKYLKNQDQGTPPSSVQRQMTISVALHRYPQQDTTNRPAGKERRHSATNWYEFTINGTTYRYEDAQDPSAVVAKQVQQWIDAEYPTITSSSISGDRITLILPAGLNVNVSGLWYRQSVFTGRRPADVTFSGDTLTTETKYLTIPTPTPQTPGALWYIKQADYSTEYRVVLDGTTFSVKTPDATSSQARAGLETRGLVAEMAGYINANANYVAGIYNGTLYITRADNADFTITYSDDLGDNASLAIKESVQTFSDLPPSAPANFQVRITGDIEEVDVDAYHVTYTNIDDNTSQYTQGYWKETVQWGSDTELDATTMPVSLKRYQDKAGYNDPDTTNNPRNLVFFVEPTVWNDKTVGDNDTAPMPSFVSQIDANGHVTTPRHIRSMSIYRNRLAFASDENIVFSEAGEFLNFFPTTVISVLDGDVIDIAIPSDGVELVEHTLEFDEALFLFSKNSQMRLVGGEVFNADSIVIDVAAKYDMDVNVAPYVDGAFIYFWSKDSVASQLMELGTDGDTRRWVAHQVTAHIPTYVEGQVVKTALSKTERTMFTVTRATDGALTDTIYVYNYLWSNGQKVQNAWQKWTFQGDIVSASVDKDVLRLIVNYTDGTTTLEEITLSYRPIVADLGHPVFLDRREEVTSNWTPAAGDERTLHTYQGRYFAGYPYEQNYVFSEIYVRNSEGRAVRGGRLQLRYMYLNYSDTTQFQVSVERDGRVTKVLDFTGRVLGSLKNLLGQVPVEDGQYQARVQSRSDQVKITITNDSVYDAVFQTADWEGTYVNRARRA